MSNFFEFFKEFTILWSRRVVIVGLYFVILIGFLYFPRVFEYFSAEKSINVYAFTEFISHEAIEEFEKDTGIKVRVQYFEFNEELYAKFKINQGEGYDLITPSDYMVELMRKDGMLQQIDLSKISNFKEIDPRLLGKYFDPQNRFSIPLCWLVYGIVYDKNIKGVNFKDTNLGMLLRDPWDLVISDEFSKHYKICMVQDPRDMIFLAAIYLFNRTDNLSQDELIEIQNLLSRQKSWVESYTDVSIPYFLASGIAHVAVMTNNRMKKLEEESDKFIFQIPKEGSLIAIENLAIPAKTKKSELAHKFIDFLISKKISAMHMNLYGSNPSNLSAIEGKSLKNPNFFPSAKMFDKLHIMSNEISLDKVDSMWLAVRFS
jgi:spermidine/putrescine transport system substrate-binding protein